MRVLYKRRVHEVESTKYLKMELRAEHLFYAAFAVFSFQYILSYTLFNEVLGFPVDALCNALKIVAFVLLFGKILFQVYAERFFVPFMALGIIALVSLYFTLDQHLIVAIVFAASSQGVTVKKVAKVNLIITLCMLVITVVCANSGLVDSVSHFTSSGDEVTSLGFTVPNRLAGFILSACVSLAIMHYPVLNLKDFVIYAAGLFVCGYVAGSSTGTLGILVTVISLCVFSFCERKRSMRPLVTCCAVLLVLLIVTSLYFMVFFNPANPVHVALDDWFTGRLELAHRYYSLFPVTEFGRDFSLMDFKVGNYDTLVVDNAYAKLFIQIGYIPSIIFLTLYLSPFVRAIRGGRCDYACLYGLTVMGSIAFVESYAFHFAINISMICLLEPLFECRRGKMLDVGGVADAKPRRLS